MADDTSNDHDSARNRETDTEAGKSFFRSSDRIFRQDGAWYFGTREGDRGPYNSEQKARLELQRYITAQLDLERLKQGQAVKQDPLASRGVSGDVWKGLPDVD